MQRMFFHHGYGGGGPVTRGAINHSRFLMQVEGADVISNGHIHEKTTGEVMVQYFDGSPRGQKAMARSVIIMQSSTYKQEFTPEGFHTERGRPPKPLGGTFITFHCHIYLMTLPVINASIPSNPFTASSIASIHSMRPPL